MISTKFLQNSAQQVLLLDIKKDHFGLQCQEKHLQGCYKNCLYREYRLIYRVQKVPAVLPHLGVANLLIKKNIEMCHIIPKYSLTYSPIPPLNAKSGIEHSNITKDIVAKVLSGGK